MKLFEATVPFFSGFYETWAGDLCSDQDYDLEYYSDNMHSDNREGAIDDGIYADFKQFVKDDDKDAFISDCLDDYVWTYDHKSAQTAYCEEYAQALCDVLGIAYHGQDLSLPKYYNFETDKVHIKIDETTLKAWIQRLHNDDDFRFAFTDIIIQRCTSYDGFISFHSNVLDDYLELSLDDWDNIKAGFLLEAVCMTSDSQDFEESYGGLMVFEELLHKHLQGNGFSSEYAADFNEILAEKLAKYRDANPEDDYIKPLPSKYLKGTVMIMPNQSNN